MSPRPAMSPRASASHAPAVQASDSAVFSVPAPGNSPSARICVYGDSLTAGFPSFEPYADSLVSALADEGVYVEVVGCGLCGMTAVEMAQGLDSSHLQDMFGRTGPGLRRFLAENGSFDLVIIMGGTNDIGMPQSSTQEIVASLKTLHRACQTLDTPSMTLSVPESSVRGTSQYPEAKQKWHAINKALKAQSPEFVDTKELISFDKASCARGLWDPDNLHFTASGSGQFGSRLAPVVAEFLSGEMGEGPAWNDTLVKMMRNFFQGWGLLP